MIIYTIRNKINGKQLIGKSGQVPKKRWSQHQNTARRGIHCNPHFQRAWNKYGEENFEFLVLDETARSVKQLNLLEIFYISNTPNLYNIQPGGEGALHSIETKEKIRKYRIGRKHSKETKQKISDANKGRLSNLKGKSLTLEHCKKISENHAGMSGKTHSKETRKKMREAHSFISENTRKKLSNSAKQQWKKYRMEKCNAVS